MAARSLKNACALGDNHYACATLCARRRWARVAVPAFEANGFLPVGVHHASEAEIEDHFVAPFPTSTTRVGIRDGWHGHRKLLTAIVAINRQWLGGSFISSKTDPSDIDLCSFLDGATLDSLPSTQQLSVKYLCGGRTTQKKWHCDSYAITEYPLGHPHRVLYEKALAYWSKHWSHTEPDANGVQLQRGYVEVP